MTILTRLQFSINGIFDLYRDHGKRLYGFAMIYAILGTIFAILLGLLVTGALYGISKTFQLAHPLDGSYSVSFSQFIGAHLGIVAGFIGVLNLGFFGIFLRRFLVSETRIRFATFFAVLKSGDWLNYLLFAFTGPIAVYLIECFLHNPFAAHEPFEHINFVSGGKSFETLLNSLVVWLLSYLAPFCGFLLIFFHIRRQAGTSYNANFWQMILTVFIIGTIVFLTAAELTAFVQYYIGGIVSAPFQEPYIPALLMMAVYIFLVGVTYPGMVGGLLFPLTADDANHSIEEPMADNDVLDQ